MENMVTAKKNESTKTSVVKNQEQMRSASQPEEKDLYDDDFDDDYEYGYEYYDEEQKRDEKVESKDVD